jgi:ribosomal protein S18 acetylase RimI-like enzyme
MPTVLTDFSAATLLTAIKANWAEYYTCLGRAPGSELSVSPHLSWCLTGVPDPFLNVVFRTRLPTSEADELIGATLAYFRTRQVESLTWWAEAESVCPRLDQVLIGQGLMFEEGGTGMAADLTALPADLPQVAGLTVRLVEDEVGWQDWVQVMRRGFGLPERSERRLYDLFAGLAGTAPMQSYLASLNGRPVGTAQLFLGAGVAGIYQVTCLAEARRQGIGTAVTWAALRAARAQNYRIAILQASEQGYGVYRGLGFQSYGKLNQYVWTSETRARQVEGNDA